MRTTIAVVPVDPRCTTRIISPIAIKGGIPGRIALFHERTPRRFVDTNGVANERGIPCQQDSRDSSRENHAPPAQTSRDIWSRDIAPCRKKRCLSENPRKYVGFETENESMSTIPTRVSRSPDSLGLGRLVCPEGWPPDAEELPSPRIPPRGIQGGSVAEGRGRAKVGRRLGEGWAKEGCKDASMVVYARTCMQENQCW
ncbi:hypothetical protein KM043_001648 [Ampulex compressa]|nr:hypothetical protein KM043_001648 [Ampulex compressa]